MFYLACPSSPVLQTAVEWHVSFLQAETSWQPNSALPRMGDKPSMHSQLDCEGHRKRDRDREWERDKERERATFFCLVSSLLWLVLILCGISVYVSLKSWIRQKSKPCWVPWRRSKWSWRDTLHCPWNRGLWVYRSCRYPHSPAYRSRWLLTPLWSTGRLRGSPSLNKYLNGKTF